MYLLLLGIILSLLKYFEVQPVAGWDWWWVLLPFPLTALWWWLADVTGYTRRKSLQREDLRKKNRIDEARKRLGMPTGKRK